MAFKRDNPLEKVADNEVVFVLRAQDRTSPIAVAEWMKANILVAPADKLREALECALAMRDFETKKIAD